VKRALLRSSSFVRAARQAVKKNPHVAEDIRTALELLTEDAFNPRLQTHKLKGRLSRSWACTVEYNLRIVKFVQHEGAEAILLETVGTHEEVY
jgi:mRNA-degrading endonuclease YafQ of YafQ-DinJ toxin-antitoxin module